MEMTLVDDRQQWILEQLGERGRVVTNDIAAELGTSLDTVRRDLRALHEQGKLRRVHGGAMPTSSLSASFSERSTETSMSRTNLARAVVERLRPGSLIGLDAGSTNVEIARQIPQTLDLTIVTNGPAVAVALGEHRSAKVILLGGALDLTWMASTGSETVDAWRNYQLDLAVLGVCGFDVERGASTASQHEVGTKRALIGAAASTIVPVQAEKLGTAASFHVAEVTAIDTMIVTDEVSKKVLSRYRKSGLEIVAA